MKDARRAGLATLALAGVLALPAACAATGLPLAPQADAFVTAKKPHTNFGGGRRLFVSLKPRSVTYLRFDLQGVDPRAGLALSIYPLGGTGSVRVRAVARRWLEHAITYRNAPRLGGVSVGSGLLTARRWNSIDVTALRGPSSTLSLALTTGTRTRLTLASREAGGFAPRLFVTDPSPSPPPPPHALDPVSRESRST